MSWNAEGTLGFLVSGWESEEAGPFESPTWAQATPLPLMHVTLSKLLGFPGSEFAPL